MAGEVVPERTAADFAKISFAELAAVSDSVYFGKPNPLKPTAADLVRREAERVEDLERKARRSKLQAEYRRRLRSQLILLTALVLIPLIGLVAGTVLLLVTSGANVAEAAIGLVIALLAVAMILAILANSRRYLASTVTSPEAWRQYEYRVAAMLRGEFDVRVGSGRGDGGVDVETARLVVQVKAWSGKVGAPEVQQIAGVAAVRRKRPLSSHDLGLPRLPFSSLARQMSR